jgi:hypothetical protein
VAYKVFSNGSVLNASEINDNLMNQSVISFSNASARTAAIPSPIQGMVTYLTDSNQIDAYDSTKWVRRVSTSLPFDMAGGLVTVPGPSPAAPSSSVAVTFPASRFSVAPIVTTNNITSVNIMPSASSVTSTGFTMNVRHVDNTNFTLAQNTRYIAIQMTSTTAEG